MAQEGASEGVGRDTLVGIAGAVLLVAAMTGVFLYERSQFDTYAVAWTDGRAGEETASGTLEQGASETFTFEVPDTAPTSQVTVRLDWTDDVGEPDEFELRVEGPGARTDTSPGAQAPLRIAFEVTAPPTLDSVPARSAEDAKAQARAALEPAGTGAWTVRVTLTDAPGEAAPIAGQETQPDGANGFEVTFAWSTWSPEIQLDG